MVPALLHDDKRQPRHLCTNYSYSASKAGVHMLSRHMAHHLCEDNVNVNTIAPGPFVSEMTKAAGTLALAQTLISTLTLTRTHQNPTLSV